MSSSLSPMTRYTIPEQVTQGVEEIRKGGKRVAVLTCGLSGSGKSTLARNLTHLPASSFIRLSIDALVLQSHGTYDSATFTPSNIERYEDAAEGILMTHLKSLLDQGSLDVVLDLSFYTKSWRDEMRELIREHGKGKYEVLLVVFRGDKEVLWERLKKRNSLFEGVEEDRGSLEGLPVSREMLMGWLDGFEWPDGEGEVVVSVE